VTERQPRSFTLHVHGPFACFSRPELKVERFSYPCITPSAARGVFDAIYVRPRRFRWQIRRIEVLKPLDYIALKRNEVKETINTNAVQRWMAGDTEIKPILADADRALTGSDEKGRTQRQTMALRNVAYLLTAEIRPWPGFEDQLTAFERQFRRRAESGKCFYQPYLGCREFPAYFDLLGEGDKPPPPHALDHDAGLMLYDVFDLARPGSSTDRPAVSLFRADIRAGVLEVPAYEDATVLKPEGAL
jgi:CRISPR-associated protein Cas5d